MMVDNSQKRELVLSPGSYAYLQDVTKGIIRVFVGPISFTPTSQDVPVIYDPSNGKFFKVETFEAAVQRSPVAVEGHYMVLLNPAVGDKHPEIGQATNSPDLTIGRKIMIPGPAMFALWPGQAAEVIRGHQLRSNQYIVARVYNDEEAKKNLPSAIIETTTKEGEKAEVDFLPKTFSVGTQFIIRGDQVSFYIPPTGISVLKDENDQYLRDALTLERLEHCILVDEDGNKRYEKGPQVVFPKPSERFIEAHDDKGNMVRKFRAVELNENQGIHIKVIAPYEENGVSFQEGQELFITGKETAIYYPREEHSVVKYEGRVKHFATAVPAGDARYVMNRNTGDIKITKGPAMLLPDPRSEVMVRRVLSKKQVEHWYPGNADVATYNQQLRDFQQSLNAGPEASQAAIPESQYRSLVSSSAAAEPTGGGLGSLGAAALYSSEGFTASISNTPSQDQMLSSAKRLIGSSRVGHEQNLQGEQFNRSNTYTPPRMVTLDAKYQGAPAIDVWTGYAVKVTSKSGNRRVEKGPVTVLLGYDESLEVLELSTGKPKTTDKPLKTVYLRVDNNQVSDIILVETSDHVQVELKLGYLVNFEGESQKWFNIENYVKFLCDHVRSVLKGKIRKLSVEEFYRNATDHIRDIVLEKSEGGKRPGMPFPQNGMRVLDVEVLTVTLKDDRIRQMLETSQHDVVKSNIELSNLQRGLEVMQKREDISRQQAQTQTDTIKLKNNLSIEAEMSHLQVQLSAIKNEIEVVGNKAQQEQLLQDLEDFKFDAHLARKDKEWQFKEQCAKTEQERQIQFLTTEAENVVKRMAAVLPGFSEALLAMSRDEVIAKVAQAMNVQTILGGNSVSESLNQVFKGTALQPVIEKMVNKAPATLNGGKSSSPSA